jgi:hypothetical protein
MSNKAMTWAWEQSDVPSGAKFVLVALGDHASDHAGEDWACYPSVERIMSFTNQSRSTVERGLAILVDIGCISRVRRKLPGGRLGIYDYVLHRDRKPSDPVEKSPDHTSNCSMVHASNCGSAMRQIDGQPHVNLTHEVTPIEPSVEPSHCAGASEAAPDWAQEVWTVWPVDGQRSSSPRMLALAIAAEIAAGADPAALLAAATAYGQDRTAWGSSGRPVAAHRFFAEGRWENFTAVTPGGPGGLFEQARTAFACAEVRVAVVAARGPAWAASWLDPCEWDEARRVIDPRSKTRGDRLRSEVGGVLKSLGVRVEGQG